MVRRPISPSPLTICTRSKRPSLIHILWTSGSPPSTWAVTISGTSTSILKYCFLYSALLSHFHHRHLHDEPASQSGQYPRPPLQPGSTPWSLPNAAVPEGKDFPSRGLPTLLPLSLPRPHIPAIIFGELSLRDHLHAGRSHLSQCLAMCIAFLH